MQKEITIKEMRPLLRVGDIKLIALVSGYSASYVEKVLYCGFEKQEIKNVIWQAAFDRRSFEDTVYMKQVSQSAAAYAPTHASTEATK